MLVEQTSPKATQTPRQMPDFLFHARVAAPGFALYPCRQLWGADMFACEVLDATPLAQVPWPTLFAYMHRRFGPGHLPANEFKHLGAGWLLSTPDPAVFVAVCPAVDSPGASFIVQCADEGAWQHHAQDVPAVSAQRLAQVQEAYRVLLLDLLRPVCVRDRYFNALEEVEDGDALLGFEANYCATSGCAMPQGFFGGPDWIALCGWALKLGGGDMERGRRRIVDALEQGALQAL